MRWARLRRTITLSLPNATFDAFEKDLVEDTEEQTFRGRRTHLSLKSFMKKRRTFLLDLPSIQQLYATNIGGSLTLVHSTTHE
jgi:hypothetical protein